MQMSVTDVDLHDITCFASITLTNSTKHHTKITIHVIIIIIIIIIIADSTGNHGPNQRIGWEF